MEPTKPVDLSDDTKTNIAHALWMKDYNEEQIPKEVKDSIYSIKNRPEQFGHRTSGQLETYLQYPIFLNPDYTDRYKTLLQYTSKQLTPHQAYAMTNIHGLDSVTGYEPIPIPSGIKLPQSDAPQWKNQVGWHFFVGNCVAEDEKEYCVEMMFWRHALLPPNMATLAGLSDIENQVVSLHLAVGDVSNGISYRAEPTIIAGTTGLIDFTSSPFTYTLGRNSIKALSADANFPIRLQAKGFGEIVAQHKEKVFDIEIDLSLAAKKKYFLEGENGCSPSIDGIGTLYYSISNLQFDEGSKNILKINGDTVELKSGKFWYDHQWATGFMPPGNTKHAVMRASLNLLKEDTSPGGWDWFMAQFDSNVEVTFAALHSIKNEKFYNQTGEKPGTMKADISGKFIDKDCTIKDISGTMKVTNWCRSVTSPNPKIYYPTNTWYPNLFEIEFNSVELPKECRKFTLKPVIDGQTGFFGNGLQYSEGGVTIFNKESVKIGMGFAEATNYADTFPNVLALSGLPKDNQEVSKILNLKQPISKKLLLESKHFLEQPGKKEEVQKILKHAEGVNKL